MFVVRDDREEGKLEVDLRLYRRLSFFRVRE